MSITAPSLAPEAGASVRAAQEALEQEARRADAVGDPTASMLRAMAQTVGATHRTLVEATLTLGKQIEAVHQPIPEVTLRNAIIQGIGVYAQDMIGALNLRTALAAAGVALVLMVASFGGGYWWHGSQQLIAGVSAGQQECHEQHGGTVCLIPIWTKLPPQ